MRKFSHIVGLVEFGGIDLVNGIGFDILLGAIVALDQDSSSWQVLDDPSADEGGGGVSEPDIALAREVVLALYDAAQTRGLVLLFRDELRGKGADGGAVAVRVGAEARFAAAQPGRAGEVCEGAVAQVAWHARVSVLIQRR